MLKAFVLLFFFQAGLQLDNRAQVQVSVSIDDLKLLNGQWEGSLTYLDYTTGKPFTMPANLTVTPKGDKGIFVCRHEYPKEASANSTDSISLSPDGTRINGKTIVSRKILANGDLEIITEYSGRDGNENKAAAIRTIYTIGKMIFSNKKEIRFQDSTEWIKRHEYFYKRKV